MAKLSLVALALSASTVLALDHAGGDHHWGVRAAAEANTVTSAAHKASATVKEAVAASSTITAKAKVAAASASASALPLTGYTYSYADIPYMVNPYVSNDPEYRGPQSGYNICNSTTAGDDSRCQTLIANSISDFCIWGPAGTEKDQSLGDMEAATVAWCVDGEKWGSRTIPPGTITGLQLMHTSAYIQYTMTLDITKLNFAADDTGGELDPHGADLLGNPLGGLVYSNGLPTGDNKTLVQAVEWNMFYDGNRACLKICDPSVTDPFYCQNVYDLIGCNYNMPAAYEDKVFNECDGEVQDVVGLYTGADGKTSTWSQGRSLDPSSTLPYTPRIPASSNCKTYQSTEILGTATTSAGASATSGASAATSVGASAAVSGDSSGGSAAASGASATGSPSSGAGSLAVGSGIFAFVAGAAAILA